MAKQVHTSEVFKQPVHCFRCDEAFYFTLRAIAEDEKLKCPVCGTGINLSDDGYKPLVASVRYTIKSICDRGPTEQVYDRAQVVRPWASSPSSAPWQSSE
jgi:hypothetical protein